ncbi:carcinoembryonic antigen-related cell adhesion molecule 3-like [Pristis pectinata]|uniref:carcinoembryonic antigen-related cell adhesion molecule 3-like n=1 Tax=Pristis pectinata TaxID=685728 RepID=UPI00223DBEBF|nr:carcinoembryonic antigen-related cell adhesion molecule 3-like [Pristis pectinata]XP_051873751.1 carcinoembryonic antigen-related cell adhesion molecule 3-like [Pristis pectinata]
MELSQTLNINMFKLASVFHLILVCRGALYARPDTVTNAAAGQTVMFPIEYQSNEDQYDITFRLKFPQLFKILTWKSINSKSLLIVHPQYKNRATIKSKSVVLYNVQVNDSGEYQIRTDYYGPELKNHDQSTFMIQVFEPVSQPVAETFSHGQNAPNITLTCSVSNERVMIYWEKISLSGVIIETYTNTVLVIDCSAEEEQYEYRCIAKNPVSNASSSEVSVNLCNIRNLNGNRNYLMILIPLAMLLAISLFASAKLLL